MRLCQNWNLVSRGNVTVNNQGEGDKRLGTKLSFQQVSVHIQTNLNSLPYSLDILLVTTVHELN